MSDVHETEAERIPPAGEESAIQTEIVVAPQAASKAVRQEVEILRILSAFGIVWFHNGRDTYGVGYGGLVVFLVLSTYFGAAKSGGATGIGQILSKRSLRLLLPWAVWMLAYGVQNHFIDRNIVETDRGWPNGILAGTRIHLWYLPYAFVATVAIDLLVGRVSKSVMGWISALGAAAILSTALFWRPWAETHGYPTVQYCHGAAGLLIGVFLACRGGLGDRFFYPLLVAVIGAAAWAAWRQIEGVGTTYLLGTWACVVALVPSRSSLPEWLDVRGVSDCMFGVYLCHIFYLRLFEDLEQVPQWAEAWLTFAAGLVSVWLFRRFLPRIARFVV